MTGVRSKARGPWPLSGIFGITPPGGRVSSPSPQGYTPAVGRLLKSPRDATRHVIEIAVTYDQGQPGRAGLTMPAPPGPTRGKNGWGYLRRFGVDIPNGGDPLTATGPNGFGVPPVGNITAGPRYRPNPPIVGYGNLTPQVMPGHARMGPPRRLTKLLPDPQNLWSPATYGQE